MLNIVLKEEDIQEEQIGDRENFEDAMDQQSNSFVHDNDD